MDLKKELEHCDRLEVYNVVLKHKKERDIINDNIHKILFKTRLGNFGKVIELVSIYEENRIYICKKFRELEGYLLPCNVEKVLDTFMKYKEYKNLILSNYLLFIESAIDIENELLSQNIIQKLKNYDKTLYDKLFELEEKSQKYSKFEWFNYINKGTLFKLIKYNKIFLLEKIIKEISIKIDEKILFLSYGYFSSVFKIGDYIIKIGRKRAKFKIPYSKYILQPYFRKEIYHNNIFICTIEIQDEVDMSKNDEKLLNEIIEKLKIENIFWEDARIWNIGIVKKDNNNYKLYKENGFMNSLKNRNFNTQRKGEVVIIDTDLIFDSEEIKERRKKCYEK